ncbi:MAG: SDR family oxidoreductase [Gammaproteobacteria bacterium]|jgi:NAD(P)-dependent dehydrogenase (short-subunit alcohol dehydrogenase family)|nr:SDR family oxidoreductase [Gammaproteobacteria bacterium]MBT3866836.1 SDR family oxidoreductase [Gammaproteobacteria bacterium]
MSLSGKVAIVSGAAQGLGRAFAIRLAEEGCMVLGFDVKKEVLDVAGVTGMVADVSKRDDVERVVSKAAGMGEIAVLVNNAGTWKKTPVDSAWQQALDDWDFIMDTNLKGVMMLSRAVVPFLQRNGGHIINLSTYYVLPAKSDGTNQPDTDLYNASKWALNGFTDAWAKYLEKDNVKVNGMCMGATDTPMLRGLFPTKQLPAEMASVVMKAEDIAGQMMEIIASGRTGENFGAWVGEEITIGDQPPLHKRITG